LVVIHEPVLEISCGQKQCAQTDTRRWSQDLAAYGAQVIIISKCLFINLITLPNGLNTRKYSFWRLL